VFSDNGGLPEADEDIELARQVGERLLGDPEITGGYVRVAVQNRVVILQGHVPTAEAKAAAGRQAWRTPGVFDVSNRLRDH
jgi:osmotically-inducible protein OsmY